MSTPMTPQPNNHPPVAHYNYDELEDDCHCPLCESYRESVKHLMECRRMTRRHPVTCTCWTCNNKRQAALDAVVAINKRDLYSELSYLTSGHKLGATFLRWIYDRITDENFRSPQWWATDVNRIALKSWMDTWQAAYLPPRLLAVSGLY